MHFDKKCNLSTLIHQIGECSSAFIRGKHALLRREQSVIRGKSALMEHKKVALISFRRFIKLERKGHLLEGNFRRALLGRKMVH